MKSTRSCGREGVRSQFGVMLGGGSEDVLHVCRPSSYHQPQASTMGCWRQTHQKTAVCWTPWQVGQSSSWRGAGKTAQRRDVKGLCSMYASLGKKVLKLCVNIKVDDSLETEGCLSFEDIIKYHQLLLLHVGINVWYVAKWWKSDNSRVTPALWQRVVTPVDPLDRKLRKKGVLVTVTKAYLHSLWLE